MWFHRAKPEVESQNAIKDSLQKLKLTELRAAPVSEVTTALRTLRERNHFAEQLESIMGGPR